MTPRFVELHGSIWRTMKAEVLKGYAQSRQALSRARRLALYHAAAVGRVFAFWYALTTPGLVSEEFAKNTAFFFGKPLAGAEGDLGLVRRAARSIRTSAITLLGDAARVRRRQRARDWASDCGSRWRRRPPRSPIPTSRR